MSERERKKLSNKLQPLFDGIYKIQDGNTFISTTFQTVPLRTGTDYYKVVQNPLSLHAVGRKLKSLKYAHAQDFVYDLALISYNARLYNHPDSNIYRQAQILKQYINDCVIGKLKNDKKFNSGSGLVYPHIGDLPEDKDTDELVGFSFENSESTPGPSSNTANAFKRDNYEMSATPQTIEPSVVSLSKPLVSTGFNKPSFGGANTPIATPTPNRTSRSVKHKETSHIESGIRRGRPPIIDKPFESRIKAILKGFKKLRDNNDQSLTKHFERLPDAKTYSDYFEIITNPICLNDIRVKVRSRKYSSVDQFIGDLDLMFANAQLYYQNDPYSEEFLDYQQFKKDANVIIQSELNKSDKEILLSTSAASDGILRYPLEELEIDGYTYRIGNWVLMRNPADAERPIVGQIFRMWSTEDGKKYCNMCWYYRPEQTCHQVDRLFFMNEVCKTGQYRDHLVDDIVGPCYVIFLTRYQKGDLPEGVIPPTAPWFICEFRYNENTHVTWKACLPDEVRDDPEQPLVQLHETRKLIKYDSPIKHLLPPGAHKGMAVPDAVPGTASSPPISGSVYIGSPLPNDDLGQYISSQNVVSVPEHDDPKTDRHAFLFTPISQLKGGGGSTNTVYATTPSLPHGSPSHVTAKTLGGDTRGLGVSRIGASQAISAHNISHNNTNANNSSHNNNSQLGRDDKPQFPGSYKSLQEQIQENQAKKQQEQQLQQLQHQQHQQMFRKTTTPAPANIVPTGTTYHSSTSTYSNLLPGGVLAYGVVNEGDSLIDDDEQDITELVNKKRKIGPDGEFTDEVLFYRAPPVNVPKNRIITNSNFELGHSASYLAWKLDHGKEK
ncbi:RSC1 Chromatin structure-remodeling complex subunit RSC1 [Candida maltosa Xu316]